MPPNDSDVAFDSEFGKDGHREREERVPVLDAMNTVIACLAVLGNGMVIAVMLLRRRVFSSFTNRLILHQSVIDSIAGLLFFLHKVVKSPSVLVSEQSDVYDELICRIVYSDVLLWCVNVTSTYNLVILSLERFVATCYPVKHRNTWSLSKLKYAVIASWAIGFIYGSHIPLVVEPFQGRCRVKEMGIGLQVFVGVTVVGTEFFVPLVILIFAYTKILIMIKKKLSTVNPVNAQQNTLSKAKKNVLVTILLAGIMFVICWTPTEFDYLDELFFNKSWGYVVSVALTGLLACNMLVNPIIYCFMYEKFRKHLKHLVLKRFQGNRVGDVEATCISTGLQVQPTEGPV